MKISRTWLGGFLALGLACSEKAKSEPKSEQTKSQPTSAADANKSSHNEQSELLQDNQPQNSQRAEEILEQAAVALGGKEKLQEIHSYQSEVEIEAKTLGLKGSGKTWWKTGDFYTEINLPGIGQTRLGIQKGVVWSEDPINGLRKLTDKEAEQAQWSSSICLVCEWKKYFKSADVSQTRQEGEQSIIDIKLISFTQDEVILSIDMETKLPIAQKFRQVAPMGDMPVTVYFSDFRPISGMKISFQQTTDTPLAQFSAVITKFAENVEVDDQLFQMQKSTTTTPVTQLKNAEKASQ